MLFYFPKNEGGLPCSGFVCAPREMFVGEKEKKEGGKTFFLTNSWRGEGEIRHPLCLSCDKTKKDQEKKEGGGRILTTLLTGGGGGGKKNQRSDHHGEGVERGEREGARSLFREKGGESPFSKGSAQKKKGGTYPPLSKGKEKNILYSPSSCREAKKKKGEGKEHFVLP